LHHNIIIFKYFTCIPDLFVYNAGSLQFIATLVHRFLTPQRPELKPYRLKITPMLLALPVSDDVIAPVE
jgi:hypothetical protein